MYSVYTAVYAITKHACNVHSETFAKICFSLFDDVDEKLGGLKPWTN
jgi:hypothetical protein